MRKHPRINNPNKKLVGGKRFQMKQRNSRSTSQSRKRVTKRGRQTVGREKGRSAARSQSACQSNDGQLKSGPCREKKTSSQGTEKRLNGPSPQKGTFVRIAHGDRNDARKRFPLQKSRERIRIIGVGWFIGLWPTNKGGRGWSRGALSRSNRSGQGEGRANWSAVWKKNC